MEWISVWIIHRNLLDGVMECFPASWRLFIGLQLQLLSWSSRTVLWHLSEEENHNLMYNSWRPKGTENLFSLWIDMLKSTFKVGYKGWVNSLTFQAFSFITPLTYLCSSAIQKKEKRPVPETPAAFLHSGVCLSWGDWAVLMAYWANGVRQLSLVKHLFRLNSSWRKIDLARYTV